MFRIGLGLGLSHGFGSAADAYAILGYKPGLALDFVDEYYRANSAATTFSAALTHSATTNGTMVDSDGLLKWRPHNLLGYSEEFVSVHWNNQGTASQDNQVEAPDGSLTGSLLQASALNERHMIQRSVSGYYTHLAGVAYTHGIFLKAGTESIIQLAHGNAFDFGSEAYVNVNLNNGTFTFIGNGVVDQSIEAVGNGWYLVKIAAVSLSSTSGNLLVSFVNPASPTTRLPQYTTSGTETVYIWGAHAYRSDLGGMVNNPDRGDSYVPTTSTARYLPRRGHHVWNGSAWVNEGLLHESEQRTNLLHTTNALVTQSLTVTAVPHTLHFTGTGTVTLSGASTAGPLVGTGTGEQNRVSLTFTPTAASLTLLTVTGTVTNAQLEVGPTPSSYIPNLAASGSVTRAADSMTIPAVNLPWPTPEYIGPELVTNGTFDSDISGWVDNPDAGGSIAWNAAGYIDIINTTGTARVYQNVTVETGKVYLLTFNSISSPTGADFFYIGSTASGTEILNGRPIAEGHNEFAFVATGTTASVSFRNFGTGSTTSLDNISVREIDPLAVSIQMQGRVTYADTGEFNTSEFFRWRLDSSNYIEGRLKTDSTDTGEPYFVQTFSGTADFADVAFSGPNYTPGINVPFNIASRHGSTFINGAVDGTALTANTTPVALPDLSATDMNLGYDYMGTIRQLRIWADDIGDAGLVEATEPSLVPSLSLTFDGTENSFIVEDWSE